MALDFPSSPTNGQVYTDANTGLSYVFNSTYGVWRANGTSAVIGTASDGEVLINLGGIVRGSFGLTFSNTANILYVNTISGSNVVANTITANNTVSTNITANSVISKAINVETANASITTTNIASFGTNSSKDKIRLYDSETPYAIGMANRMTFGPLRDDWAMTFQMNDDIDRGFWWGDVAHSNAQGAMALTTDGNLYVASKIRLGYGESDISDQETWPYRLDISGNVNVATNLIVGGNVIFDSPGSTRIWDPAANTLSFYTSQAERMKIDAAGNVGIGITSPVYKLDVAGGFRFANNNVTFTDGGGLTPTYTSALTQLDGYGLELKTTANTFSPFLGLVTANSSINRIYVGNTSNGIAPSTGPATMIFQVGGYETLFMRKDDDRPGSVIFGGLATDKTYNDAAILARGRWDGAPAAIFAKRAGTAVSEIVKVMDDTLAVTFLTVASSGNVGIRTTTPAYSLEVAGSFAAQTKSFVINHQSKPNSKLVYGSLEGPENGVYIRGETKSNIIELPEYWTWLVNQDSITVTLTPIGKHQRLFVKKIEDNKIYISNSTKNIHCYYLIQGERKDVAKLQVEI